jgi:hypothetical protein
MSRTRRPSEVMLSWPGSALVPLCRALCCRDIGEAPAPHLGGAVALEQGRLTDCLKDTPAKTRKAALEEFGGPLVALLEAAQIIREKGIHRQILELLATVDAELLPLQVAVLRACSGGKNELHAPRSCAGARTRFA